MNRDIHLVTDKQIFRLRACAIIINDNRVLMVKNEGVDYYYSVGGAVQIGETLEEACLREAYEETGVNYQIDRLAYIHETFFKLEGKLYHELAFYYLMVPNQATEFSVESYGINGEREHLSWIDIDAYSRHKAYPEFFKDELKAIPDKVTIITTSEC